MPAKVAAASGATSLSLGRQKTGLAVLVASGGLAILGMIFAVTMGPLNISSGDMFTVLLSQVGRLEVTRVGRGERTGMLRNRLSLFPGR